ncbi:DUF1766-domain-containing protein [Dothidotthia symphoricarpi CBS 119687]|uniref:DUF1766-domain-containing protein n=1 Tax=Dothidotthia symphoricarpi CBS 119687 TaxID=1392245 RepID=A0A6A6AA21_9PLEO|nr:DUF1766-domain-containing protein [Dothidotthia symphoricarpi CBS 119687]KAF2128670.1 DUF1766-domain-containing protein [Dothidotthia symphoricarpi CBS 119687]
MSFQGRTPESLMPRSDSRNPATTCKGITKSGRPCRRPIDAKPSQDNGVIAVASVANDSDEEDIGAAAYFCWQHKDQAEKLAAQGPDTQLYPLKERSSIDTLIQRLGVLDVHDEEEVNEQKQGKGRRKEHGRIHRPPTWDQVQGPLMSVPSDLMAEKKRRDRPAKPAPRRKKQSFWASLCCGAADEDEDEPVQAAHHKKRTSEIPMQQTPPRRRNSRPSTSSPARNDAQETSVQPSVNEPTGMARYIPSTLPPQLASTLLAQASKPISPHDEEGYIYIFWLTPDAVGPAPSSTASTLLTPPSRPDAGRRTSDVLRQYSVKNPQRARPDATRQRSAADADGATSKETILLKIGRANNVHRRMNEWTQQCGYSLSLVRFYPYVSSTSAPSPQASPNSRQTSDVSGVRKVPHAHRVERMVHLELAAQRVVKKCDACGKEHREWFEVEATKEGVKKVDEVVRRWVEWDEKSVE